MERSSLHDGSISREIKQHINTFCNIRDPKKKLYIIQKLSKTLTNTAKAELGRKPEQISFSSVLDLVKQYLFRLRIGFCIHDKRQDSYVLLNDELLQMQKNKNFPQDLCEKCITPRICKLRSVVINEKQIAGLFINVKRFA